MMYINENHKRARLKQIKGQLTSKMENNSMKNTQEKGIIREPVTMEELEGYTEGDFSFKRGEYDRVHISTDKFLTVEYVHCGALVAKVYAHIRTPYNVLYVVNEAHKRAVDMVDKIIKNNS